MPPDNLTHNLTAQLPQEARALLEAIIQHAAGHKQRAFLVGGPVRDLLFDRPSLDIDIAIEGDAIVLAREVAEATGAKLAKTSEFGTAVITVVGQGPSPDTNSRASTHRFDLTAARTETYARPGALPKVRPAAIDDDLLRRDFTIHAMALELTGPARGKLLDPTGGVADLRAGLVRALHDHSFQDDPTRILRAARYAARFGFRIEEATLDLIARDLRYLDKVSGTRLRQEMAHVFTERHPDTAIALLDELGVLQAIHPSLTATDRQLAAFRTDHELDPNVAWALLAFNASEDDVTHLVRRLALTRKQADAVRAMPALRVLEPQLTQPLRPSELDKLLSPFPEPTLLAFAAAGEPIGAQRVREYLDRKRTVRTILNGDDVVELGIPRGPDVAGVLAELRAARLDGEVTTREDEARFVEAYLARELAGF